MSIDIAHISVHVAICVFILFPIFQFINISVHLWPHPDTPHFCHQMRTRNWLKTTEHKIYIIQFICVWTCNANKAEIPQKFDAVSLVSALVVSTLLTMQSVLQSMHAFQCFEFCNSIDLVVYVFVVFCFPCDRTFSQSMFLSVNTHTLLNGPSVVA